jgi:hypothetical protein
MQLKQNNNSDKNLTIIRSLSKVQIIMKGDYTEFFQVLRSGLYLLGEQYETLYVSNFILFYSINQENSIITKSIITQNEKIAFWNNINKTTNKNNLKINYKNLPNTTNLIA